MLFFRDAQGGIIIKVIKVKLNKTRTKKKTKEEKRKSIFQDETRTTWVIFRF